MMNSRITMKKHKLQTELETEEATQPLVESLYYCSKFLILNTK